MEHRIEKGENVFIHSRAYVAGNVTLGDNANVWCGACIRGDLAPVKIGKNTNVQDNATVHVGYNVPCEIGFNVTVGHNAVVHGAKIGNNVSSAWARSCSTAPSWRTAVSSARARSSAEQGHTRGQRRRGPIPIRSCGARTRKTSKAFF